MDEATEFTETEQKLIQASKDTLRILAKVIEDRDIDAVITQAELEAAITIDNVSDDDAKFIAQAIRDNDLVSSLRRDVSLEPDFDAEKLEDLSKELNRTIKRAKPSLEIPDADLIPTIQNLEEIVKSVITTNRITPNLPQLGASEEAAIVGQLGALIFTELLV